MILFLGKPEPVVKWAKSSTAIKVNERVSLSQEGSRYLLIVVACIPDDAGEYICEAANSAGRVSCKIPVTVTGVNLSYLIAIQKFI